jgi:FecR protein
MPIIAIILTLVFLAYPRHVWAGAVGNITTSTAPASVERGNSTLNGGQGAEIQMQDAVSTTTGKVNITFRDDSLVEVNDHSRLEIDEFVFDPTKPTTSKLALNFAQGTVRYASGAIAHNDPNKVNLQTPSATIAVRGTDFTATVDEVGASTIILLPKCPTHWVDIERDCKTGAIDVFNDTGLVSLNKPFQATRVQSRNEQPTRPVILNLTSDTINNLLIVSPPAQIQNEVTQIRINKEKGTQDLRFVDGNILQNIFALANSRLVDHTRDINTSTVADANRLTNIVIGAAAPLNSRPASGSETYRPCLGDGSSNIQCVAVPSNQSTTIFQTQGTTSIMSKINNGGNTLITLRQN